MNKENCALKLVDEIILHYDALSKKNIKLHKIMLQDKVKLQRESWLQ